MTNMYNIGKIVNTHGIRGDLKVLRISDFEERFMKGQTVYMEGESASDGMPESFTISSHKQHKGFDLVRLEGYENINDVEQFKGKFLKISEEQLTDLAENEFYYHEIIGCEVFTDNTGDKLGVVKEILSPGANDVWVVKQKKGKDILIPYIEDVVKDVDVEAKKVVIEPMEGLLD
ncbi:ribosome maturation factor RimM [Virgibacillus xinjiangensis]|uniref:Ribosome maturation factor RimM n=1 Tax=Virgibacillus xinjiangensis TaxID=393090 RepID=A0ABV7CW40_9BACI